MKEKTTERKRKLAFFEESSKNSRSSSCFQLSAKNIGKVFTYYRDKHHIQLIKNGDHSPLIIEANKAPFQQQINDLKNDEMKYANFFRKVTVDPCSAHNNFKIVGYDEPELYAEVMQHFSTWLEPDGTLKQDLPEQEMKSINSLCQNQLSETARRQLDDCITFAIDELTDEMDDLCLTKNQAILEIRQIQNSLEDEEVVGYIFTNNKMKYNSHFEPLIITKDKVIKPIQWDFVEDESKFIPEDFEDIPYYSPQLQNFWIGKSNTVPQQQADIIHCGILSVSCLKKILQNNAHNLLTEGLFFSYYNQKGELNHFYLPHPSTIQYSQSSAFIYTLMAILGQEEDLLEPWLKSDTTPVTGESRYDIVKKSVITIENMLTESIQFAEKKGNTALIEKTKEILVKLPEIRKQWISDTIKACEKRDIMKSSNRIGGNIYLNYAAKRMQKEIVASKSKGTDSLSKPTYPPVLFEYGLKRGTISDAVVIVLEQINEEKGEKLALDVAKQLILWAENKYNNANLDGILGFIAFLNQDNQDFRINY